MFTLKQHGNEIQQIQEFTIAQIIKQIDAENESAFHEPGETDKK